MSSATTDAPTAPPAEVVMTQMICGGIWLTQSLYVVAELGIADLVATDARTPAELARLTETNADALGRVLRALASVGVFAEDHAGRYGLTPLAETLRADRPGSLQGLALLWGDRRHWHAWEHFLDTVRDGRSSIGHAYGKELFELFAGAPDLAARFDAAMTGFSLPEAAAIVAALDVTGIGTLVDVGGGRGLLLATILRAHPGLRGVLFDLPQVIAGANEPAALGVADRCATVGGDFFQAVPAGDAYILKNIVHDFDDDQTVAILASCRHSAAPGARLILAQEALPPGNAPSAGKLLDLQMLFIGGRERTEAEYRALMARAGWELRSVTPTPCPLHLIEGIAV